MRPIQRCRKVTGMPHVTLRIVKGFATPEVKAKFIAKISDAVVDVIVEDSGADREKVLANTTCIVEEVPVENWGAGGVPLTVESVKELIGISE